ncbi:MAG TPA: PASTA domain-containing protein [Candidatus Limnocylindrales bacterium]|nr:PASTA domain-containing protein [Candidatus Limnocylindrales bacterium]
MKEFFDQLRDEAERRELPSPGELRARGDRRAARRGAAGAFSLAVVMAGGFIAARPLFQEPPIIAHGVVSASPATPAPGTVAVPNVVGLSRVEATTVLQQQGFKVHVMTASPPASGSPQAGKVRQQDPVAAKRIPSETTVTIWVDQPEEVVPVCADKYPKAFLKSLFVQAEVEICYADDDPLTTTEALPVPCPPTILASEALVEDRRGFSGTFTEEIPNSAAAPTMLHQTITSYKGTGAKDYLTELTRDVGRCQPFKRGAFRLTYSMAIQTLQDKLGDQSLLINVEYRYLDKPEGGFPQAANYLIAVVRMGVNVIVVYDKGWEGTPSKRETILGTAREMFRRLTASPSPSR